VPEGSSGTRGLLRARARAKRPFCCVKLLNYPDKAGPAGAQLVPEGGGGLLQGVPEPVWPALALAVREALVRAEEQPPMRPAGG